MTPAKIFRLSVAPFVVLVPLLFLIGLPLAMIALASIRGGEGNVHHFTLQAWSDLFKTRWIWETAFNTFGVAFVATVIAFIVGTPLAWLIARVNVPHRNLLNFLCLSPLFLSPLLSSVAWDMIGSRPTGIINFLTGGLFQPEFRLRNFWGISLIMGFYFSSYVFLYLWGAFRNVDPAIEEAAAIAGLGPFSTFLRITVPTILPAIAFVGLLIFVLALGLFSIPAVLGWPEGFFVLSTRIFFLLSIPPVNWGMAGAMAVLFLPVILFGIYLQRRLVRKGDFTLVSGKSARNIRIEIGRWRWPATAFIWFYWFIVAGLPTIVMAVISMTAYAGAYAKLSFLQYHKLLEYELFHKAVQNSLITSILGATLAVVISLGLSYLIQRLRPRWSPFVEYLVSVPLGIPGVVLGAALLWTWLALPLSSLVYGSLAMIIIACITQFLTTGVRSVSAVLVQIGRDVEESAWVSGATRMTTIRRILVPMLLPGLQSGWILMFILFFRELSAVLLLWSSRTITLPVLTFEIWREGSYPRLAAAGMVETILIGSVVLLVLLLGSLWQVFNRFRSRHGLQQRAFQESVSD